MNKVKVDLSADMVSWFFWLVSIEFSVCVCLFVVKVLKHSNTTPNKPKYYNRILMIGRQILLLIHFNEKRKTGTCLLSSWLVVVFAYYFFCIFLWDVKCFDVSRCLPLVGLVHHHWLSRSFQFEFNFFFKTKLCVCVCVVTS